MQSQGGLKMELIGVLCVVGSVVIVAAIVGLVVWITRAAASGGRMIALEEAADSGDLAAVKTLVSKGVDIDTTNDQGKTPLHTAIESDHPEIALFLIEKGADVHKKSQGDDFTPLHYATQGVFLDVVEALLQHGADVNAVANSEFVRGFTPLHGIASNTAMRVLRILSKEQVFEIEDEVDIARRLLAAGADPKAVYRSSDKSRTALEAAAIQGRAEVCRVLLEAGADPDIVVDSGTNGDAIERLLSTYRRG
jgi:ankyrin repeat protein